MGQENCDTRFCVIAFVLLWPDSTQKLSCYSHFVFPHVASVIRHYRFVYVCTKLTGKGWEKESQSSTAREAIMEEEMEHFAQRLGNPPIACTLNHFFWPSCGLAQCL